MLLKSCGDFEQTRNQILMGNVITKAMRKFQTFILLISAGWILPAVTIEQYHPHDFVFSAQASGNPFDVEITGKFTGPDGTRITVPGYYAGNGTWKIRFTPTAVGPWSMNTVSPVAALNGHVETGIQCTKNSNPVIHGGLRID